MLNAKPHPGAKRACCLTHLDAPHDAACPKAPHERPPPCGYCDGSGKVGIGISLVCPRCDGSRVAK